MVSALASRSSGPCSSPGQGICTVFFIQVYNWVREILMLGATLRRTSILSRVEQKWSCRATETGDKRTHPGPIMGHLACIRAHFTFTLPIYHGSHQLVYLYRKPCLFWCSVAKVSKSLQRLRQSFFMIVRYYWDFQGTRLFFDQLEDRPMTDSNRNGNFRFQWILS